MRSTREDCRIDVTLTFKRDSRYCCAEPGCHLGLSKESQWFRLRKHVEEAGIAIPFPMTIHVMGVVEEGALLDVLSQSGVMAASRGFDYEEEYREDAATPGE